MFSFLFFPQQHFYPFPRSKCIQKNSFVFMLKRLLVNFFFPCRISQWIGLWIKSSKILFQAQGPRCWECGLQWKDMPLCSAGSMPWGEAGTKEVQTVLLKCGTQSSAPVPQVGRESDCQCSRLGDLGSVGRKLVIFSKGAGRDDSHTVGLRTVRDTRSLETRGQQERGWRWQHLTLKASWKVQECLMDNSIDCMRAEITEWCDVDE